jgi:hypothetical protein
MAEKIFFQKQYNFKSKLFGGGIRFDFNESRQVQEDIITLRNTISKLNSFVSRDEPMLRLQHHSRKPSELNVGKSFLDNFEGSCFSFRSKAFSQRSESICEYKKVNEISIDLFNRKKIEKKERSASSDIELDDVVESIMDYQRTEEKKAESLNDVSNNLYNNPRTTVNETKAKDEEDEVNFSISVFDLEEKGGVAGQSPERIVIIDDYRSETITSFKALDTEEDPKSPVKEPHNCEPVKQDNYFDINNLNLSDYLHEFSENTTRNPESSRLTNVSKESEIIKSGGGNDSFTRQCSDNNISSFRKRVQFSEGNVVKYFTNKSKISNYVIRSTKIPPKKANSNKNVKSILKSNTNNIQTSINEVTIDIDKQLALDKLNELIKECGDNEGSQKEPVNNVEGKIFKKVKRASSMSIPKRVDSVAVHHHHLCKKFEKNPKHFFTDPKKAESYINQNNKK